jgi:hypothetical protein
MVARFGQQTTIMILIMIIIIIIPIMVNKELHFTSHCRYLRKNSRKNNNHNNYDCNLISYKLVIIPLTDSSFPPFIAFVYHNCVSLFLNILTRLWGIKEPHLGQRILLVIIDKTDKLAMIEINIKPMTVFDNLVSNATFI